MDIGKQQRIIQVEPEPLTVPPMEPPADERQPASVPAPQREAEPAPVR